MSPFREPVAPRVFSMASAERTGTLLEDARGGAVHTWLVRSDQAAMLLTLAPAGLEGFFAEAGVPAFPGELRAKQLDVDLEEMNRRAEAYGVEFVGPPPRLDD